MFKNFFHIIQTHYYSVPLSKENFFIKLKASNLNVSGSSFTNKIKDDNFYFENPKVPVLKIFWNFVAYGKIISSSESETKIKVTYRLNLLDLLLIFAAFFILLYLIIKDIISSSIGNSLCFNFYYLLPLVPIAFYFVLYFIGQTLIEKFENFINSCKGKEIQNDK